MLGALTPCHSVVLSELVQLLEIFQQILNLRIYAVEISESI